MTPVENGFLQQLDLAVSETYYFQALPRNQQDDIANQATEIISNNNQTVRKAAADLLRFYASILDPVDADLFTYLRNSLTEATDSVQRLEVEPANEPMYASLLRKEQLAYWRGKKVMIGNILDRFPVDILHGQKL